MVKLIIIITIKVPFIRIFVNQFEKKNLVIMLRKYKKLNPMMCAVEWTPIMNNIAHLPKKKFWPLAISMQRETACFFFFPLWSFVLLPSVTFGQKPPNNCAADNNIKYYRIIDL